MEKLEELKNKYEELGKEIEKLEKPKKKRWRAEEGQRYYYIDKCYQYKTAVERFSNTDNFRYKIRNYFQTTPEVVRYISKIKTYCELMDLADELNNGEEIDWKNINQSKYHFVHNYEGDELIQETSLLYKELGQIYCLDEDFLEKAKERIGEERLIELFEED